MAEVTESTTAEEIKKLQKAPKIRFIGAKFLVEIHREDGDGVVKTKSGIYIPQVVSNDTPPPITGTVESISFAIEENNIEVPKERLEVGEDVMFSKYAGSQFEKYGKKYAILMLTDVLGVLED